MKVELSKQQINILLQVLQKAQITIEQAATIQQLMIAVQTPVAINPAKMKTTRVKEVKKK